MFCVLVQLQSVVVAGGSSMRRCATWCCIFTRTSGVSSAMHRSARRQMLSVCTTLWQLEPQTTSRSSMCFGSRQPTGPSLSSRPGRFIYQSSWVWTFVAGAILAVQSQQHRTTVHDTHSCSQHCLVLEQVGLELVFEWRKQQFGDRSRFEVLGPYALWSKAVLASRRLSPWHQESPGDCRARLATTVRRCRRHTQVMWRCVVKTLQSYSPGGATVHPQ